VLEDYRAGNPDGPEDEKLAARAIGDVYREIRDMLDSDERVRELNAILGDTHVKVTSSLCNSSCFCQVNVVCMLHLKFPLEAF